MTHWKEDNRQPHRGWAPGDYLCTCADCGARFIGAKRSRTCADCAYAIPEAETAQERQQKWDLRFLGLAQHVAQWSKDPRTKVGAVIVRPDLSVASMGYNGFVRGLVDDPEMLADRDVKLRFTVHAEANAIVHAREPLHGMTFYTTLRPCAECCKLAIQAGIKRFVSFKPSREHLDRWGDSFAATDKMIIDCKLDATWYDLTPLHGWSYDLG